MSTTTPQGTGTNIAVTTQLACATRRDPRCSQASRLAPGGTDQGCEKEEVTKFTAANDLVCQSREAQAASLASSDA